MALKLYRAYSSSRAQYRAMHDITGESEWTQTVPLGSPWMGPLHEESSENIGITTKKTASRGTKKTAEKNSTKSNTNPGTTESLEKSQTSGPAGIGSSVLKDDSKEPFKGDRVLAKSISLMRDLFISAECAYAVADGDAGHVYEVLKVRHLSSLLCRTLTVISGNVIHLCRVE